MLSNEWRWMFWKKNIEEKKKNNNIKMINLLEKIINLINKIYNIMEIKKRWLIM
jgi:hypothetical protein